MTTTSLTTKFGKDSVIKIGTAALENARSIQLNMQVTEVETTKHGASYKTYDSVIHDISISHKMLAFAEDTDMTTIFEAFTDKSSLEIECKDSATGIGVKGTFKVFKFNQTHNDDGAIEVDVEYKPCRAATDLSFSGVGA